MVDNIETADDVKSFKSTFTTKDLFLDKDKVDKRHILLKQFHDFDLQKYCKGYNILSNDVNELTANKFEGYLFSL